jgi:hypothetical protein
LEKFVTRLGWRLKRLEEVRATANEEPTTIRIHYVDVNGEVTDEQEVVLRPRRRLGSVPERSAPNQNLGEIR